MKTKKETTLDDVTRDGSALGVTFVIGSMLEKLRETYYHENGYVTKIDQMRKLNEELYKDLLLDFQLGVKEC